jgi:hypothetical protein
MGFDKALIIGNGESRKGLNLEELKQGYFTIGCNALYRDFTPHILVSVDKDMINEVIGNEYAGVLLKRTYDYVFEYRGYLIKDLKMTCGATAIDIALGLGFKEIDLIGFDLDKTGIYLGTKNYDEQSNADAFKRDILKVKEKAEKLNATIREIRYLCK